MNGVHSAETLAVTAGVIGKLSGIVVIKTIGLGLAELLLLVVLQIIEELELSSLLLVIILLIN